MNVINPKESAELISSLSEDVKISVEGVVSLSSQLVKMMKGDRNVMNIKAWKKHPLNPKVANSQAVDWIFLVDALNFSFWTPTNGEKYKVNYKSNAYTGYWSLCAAVNRAVDELIPITSAQFCCDLTEDEARKLFRSDSGSSIPMLQERVAVMNEIGRVLLEKYDGSFSNCVLSANGSAQTLLRLIVNDFPCYRDECDFNGQRVSFYKRAQILVADLWACFEGEGLGKFHDIDSITMFADYRIPQTLVYFKVLSYSDHLMELLEKDHMFGYGDRMEMEIRAVSIHAVEMIQDEIRKIVAKDHELQGVNVNAILIDHYLWDYRREHDQETRSIPYHKVRCIYY